MRGMGCPPAIAAFGHDAHPSLASALLAASRALLHAAAALCRAGSSCPHSAAALPASTADSRATSADSLRICADSSSNSPMRLSITVDSARDCLALSSMSAWTVDSRPMLAASRSSHAGDRPAALASSLSACPLAPAAAAAVLRSRAVLASSLSASPLSLRAPPITSDAKSAAVRASARDLAARFRTSAAYAGCAARSYALDALLLTAHAFL